MITFHHERLNTNYTPTPAEIESLRFELSALDLKLRRIEDKTSKLERHLKELNQQRDALNAKVTGYQGMLSPARRLLLPDILREIFVHCLPVGRNPAMSYFDAPLLLGRVCSQWREIAYSTPVLWSAVHIEVSSDSPSIQMHTCSHATRLQAIAKWLSRSGICPIHISVHCTPHTFLHAASTIDSYLRTFRQFTTRCSSFLFSGGHGLWWSFLSKYKRSDFISLRHIHLDGSQSLDWYNNEVTETLKKFPLFASPGLRVVSLMDCGPRVMCFQIRWNQLTVLNLWNPNGSFWSTQAALLIENILLLLSWCPELECCGILVSEDAVTTYDTGSKERASKMVFLPHLITFHIQCNCDPKLLLNHLDTPSLKYLRYHQGAPNSSMERLDGEEKALHISLGPFVQRVIHQIEELGFFAPYLAAPDLLQCLEFFPDLKRLSLHGLWGETRTGISTTSISDQILKPFVRKAAGTNADHDGLFVEEEAENSSLTGGDAKNEEGVRHNSDIMTQSLCPKLEVLNLTGASFSDEMMLGFIRSRLITYQQNKVSQLRWLMISFVAGRSKDNNVLKELEDLKKESGAYINIIYSESLFNQTITSRQSPYVGLASVDFEGDPTHSFIPSFGTMSNYRD